MKCTAFCYWALVTILLVSVPCTVATGRRSLSLDDLFRFQRVADPQISPDGKRVVYVVTTVDLAGNKTTANLWLASGRRSAAAADHGAEEGPPSALEPRRQADPVRVEPLRRQPALGHRPGRRRGPTAHDDQHRGQHRALVARRQMDRLRLGRLPGILGQAVRRERRPQQETQGGSGEEPGQGKVFTRLFYRHWDEYVEDKRQHLFVMAAPRRRTAAT